MGQVIALAFCCLVATALNDFVFKLYADKAGSASRGCFFTIIGVIWCAVLLPLPHDPEAIASQTLLWGAVSGTFSFVANVLLIESMRRESASVCSTLYRLNLVLVPVGAYFLFDERLSMRQLGGVLFAILAVIMFFPMGEKTRRKNGYVGYAMVIAASVLRACLGLSFRMGYVHHADKNLVSVIVSLFWVFGGLPYAMILERKPLNFKDKNLLLYGVVSGGLVAAVIYFMAAMLNIKEGNTSVSLAIAQMSFLGTMGLSVAFLKERFTLPKMAAVLAGVAAVFLLAIQ